ncbi:MAG: lytic transglycosylase domain-containing protein, partial [Halanaerobiaceae bacterium]
IIKGARKYSLDPYLISSMIYVESKFVEGAHSHKGAVGLMQIMPGTAKWIAESRGEVFQQEKLYRPEINIDYGCWYLARLKKEFGGDTLLVLAAYNAGRGTLKHWFAENSVEEENMLETIPYPETRNYVRQVMKVYEIYSDLYELKERV